MEVGAYVYWHSNSGIGTARIVAKNSRWVKLHFDRTHPGLAFWWPSRGLRVLPELGLPSRV